MLKTFIALMLGVSLSEASAVNFQSKFLKSKNRQATEARVTPWNLADWLEEKRQVRLMDQWLVAHRSPDQLIGFNFGGGGVWRTHRVIVPAPLSISHETLQKGQAELSLSLLRISGEYEHQANKSAGGGAVGISLLGDSAQTTGLVGRYGARRRWEIGESVLNRFVEGELQLYVFRFFGMTGNYRFYFPASSNLQRSWSGENWSAGAFFEFAKLRIYASYLQENLKASYAPTGVVTDNQSNEGIEAGVRIFL